MYQPAAHPNKLIMPLISRASMVQIRVAIPYLVVSNDRTADIKLEHLNYCMPCYYPLSLSLAWLTNRLYLLLIARV